MQLANWGGGGVQGQSQPSTSQAASDKQSPADETQAASSSGSLPSSEIALLQVASADTTSQKLQPARAGVANSVAAARPARPLRQAPKRVMTEASPFAFAAPETPWAFRPAAELPARQSMVRYAIVEPRGGQ
jgi:hypothetical protein